MAVLPPDTLAIVIVIVIGSFPEPAEQVRAVGVWAALGRVALPAAPLPGRLPARGPGWRRLLVVNVPIVVTAALVTMRPVPPGPAGAVLTRLFFAALTFSIVRSAGRLTVAVLLRVTVADTASGGFVAAERRP